MKNKYKYFLSNLAKIVDVVKELSMHAKARLASNLESASVWLLIRKILVNKMVNEANKPKK